MLTPLKLVQNLDFKFDTFLYLATSDKPAQLRFKWRHVVPSNFKFLLCVFISQRWIKNSLDRGWIVRQFLCGAARALN